MISHRIKVVLSCMILILFVNLPAFAMQTSIDWKPWDEAQFVQAKTQNKLILLDLEAVWCHWCHVMDQVTYQDETVTALIAKHYIAVKVDHDARPDLAERYREYGWPATIILDAEGRDIVKRAGYIEPAPMAKLLQTVINNPKPESASISTAPAMTYASSALLDKRTRLRLQSRFINTHDVQSGSLVSPQKYLDMDTEDYALLLASQGDQTVEEMVRRDLNAGMNLLDPVWGGMYQYSTHGDWQHPHYEKLAQVQADYLRLYAEAARVLNEPHYLQVAQAIRNYVKNFLTSPDGLIYSSQDADVQQGQKAHAYFALDDDERRAVGMPRVDTHIYTKTNGSMIAALATLYSTSGIKQDLADAIAIARGMIAQRMFADGGFSHDVADTAGPYLADNLAMAQGFMALFEVTGQSEWLHRAWATADYIDKHFRATSPGYQTAVQTGKLVPGIQVNENIALTRVFNKIYRYGGRERDRQNAIYAMRYLVTPAIALASVTEAGILLADFELANPPAHLTVVGAHEDLSAKALHQFLLAYPLYYRRIDWWDPSTGVMDNPDVKYPDLGRAAAFVCVAGRCSLPAYDVDTLQRLMTRSDAR